jgi:hypothetical protein
MGMIVPSLNFARVFLRLREKSLKPFCHLNLNRIEQDASCLDHLSLQILLRRYPFLAIVTVLIGSAMPVAAQAIRQIGRIPRTLNAQSAANCGRISRSALV